MLKHIVVIMVVNVICVVIVLNILNVVLSLRSLVKLPNERYDDTAISTVIPINYIKFTNILNVGLRSLI
jgi:hypothetical protein